MLEKELLDALIAVGQKPPNTEKVFSADQFKLLVSQSKVNCQLPEFWEATAAGLSNEQISDLMKGLARAESGLKWSGGSVCGGRWLYQVLLDRKADDDFLIDLSRTIRQYTKNPYNPFGNITQKDHIRINK